MKINPLSKTIAAVNKTIDIIHNEKIHSIPEFLEFLGCLGIQIGNSVIKATTNLDPTIEFTEDVIKRLYLEEDNPGAAIVLQGHQMLHWKEQLEQLKARR